jgi:hypothetical protein
MIEIRTKGNWTITGPVWITGLPISGTGDFDYEPAFATNTTGVYRQGTIVVSIAASSYVVNDIDEPVIIPAETINVPVVQYAFPYMITGKIFILGLDADAGQNVHYYVAANGNVQESSLSACGDSVYISGRPQTGIIPNEGGVVTVRVYNPVTDLVKTFIPSGFNNKVYWKTSSTPIDTGEEVVSTGTLITMTDSMSGYYQGTFSASYASNKSYFYIAFDMRNQMNCGDTVRVDFDTSLYPINIRFNYTAGTIGKTNIDYTGDDLAVMTATYDGNVVASGFASDIYHFVKYSGTVNYLDVNVDIQDALSGGITIGSACPTTTGFTMVTTGSTSYSTACGYSSPTATRYHNGVNTYPSVGDVVYTTGTTPMDGDNKYYKIHAASVVIKIDDNGYVTEVLSCTCGESLVPVVTTNTYEVFVGSSHQVKLSATHNPSAWRMTSSFNNYTISGGDNGGKYNYTDLTGTVIYDTVGIGQNVQIVSSTTPVCTGATYTLDSVYIPFGASIDNSGVLSIAQLPTGTYTFSVIAENCVGSSTAQTITINVNHPPTLSPFKMSDEGSATSPAACALSGCEQTFWFVGTLGDPKVNDIIYIDGYGKDYFNGGYQYYKTSTNKYILIDGIGQVIEINSCA